MADHTLRGALTAELHARPFAPLAAPERVSHVAMLNSPGSSGADHTHLAELCHAHGVTPPPADATHALIELGRFRLKWERHGEFCTWTFLVRGPFADPFVPPAIAAVPAEWLARLPGERLVATHLALEPRERPERRIESLEQWLAREFLAGGVVADGLGRVWTDFRVHGDGFSRILVEDRGLVDAWHVGRVTQRLLEIETYRLMALLGLPVAREAGPRITAVDQELAAITRAMGAEAAAGASSGAASGAGDPGAERQLLDRLMALAAEVERITAAADYRFGATRAYHALVERRIAELREQRIAPGVPTLGETMDRRLAPAMRTCAATAARLTALAERLARSANLLRTRVDVALEQLNHQLLTSMDRRAHLQLRLQATVEGLSVAAISYYVVGLIGHFFEAAKHAGAAFDAPAFDPVVATGVAVPFVVAAVWLLVRRIRRHVGSHGGPDRDP
jgi:uncharacterized membrane-anchored protein